MFTRVGLAVMAVAASAASAGAADTSADTTLATAFLKSHCLKCHHAEKPAGSVRLDDLADFAKDGGRWLAARDQVRDGLMPPKMERRPADGDARAFVAWVTLQSGAPAAPLPNQGNLIPHELLFGKPAAAGPPAGRVWRLSPEAYMGFAADLYRGKIAAGVVQPFTLTPERGIKDFAGLYAIDEPSAEVLLRNAEAIVTAQTAHEVKDGKVVGKNDAVREFLGLMDPAVAPTTPQLEAAVHAQYRMAIGRPATPDESDRLLRLYDLCLKTGDRPGSARTMLQAVLLRTDAMFRRELGHGGGRRILTPPEAALALSLALGNRRDPWLTAAAAKGELATREQIAAGVRRLLDDPKADKPRLLKFFREYFEYAQAANVFKDKPTAFAHEPQQYVADTDRLVLHVLAADRDVLRELLTTDKSFVNYGTAKNKQTRLDEPKPAVVTPPRRDGKTGVLTPIPSVEAAYGFKQWEPRQPMTLPPGTRLGVLMQPSWLVAWSTNFDTDPVRRGRWVRERLLGGAVPDLPIGVVAQVPNDPHRTYRDRLAVTRAELCWKCHRQMDDLGLPFENFDHYGRFRAAEDVVDAAATEKNIDKKGNPLGAVHKQVSLVTTGAVAASGDAGLDGPVKDPREFVKKLAASARVRQVFIRHVFRFYMGRNETLADAKALQDADREYVGSGGSFKALLVSLLTSESFLYRTGPPGPKEMK